MASDAVATDNPFRPRTILLAIAAGLLAFSGFLVVSAYAPEWRSRTDGGVHAQSRSAVGLYGLYHLVERLEPDAPYLARSRDDWWSRGLLIVPLGLDSDLEALDDLVRIRRSPQMRGATTLYILPKWFTERDPSRLGWVRSGGAMPPFALDGLVKRLGPISVTTGRLPRDVRLVDATTGAGQGLPPAELRWLAGDVAPVLGAGAGRAVLGRIGANAFVLSDPDLLNNQALKTRAGAARALDIVQGLRPYKDREVAFDMVLTGAPEKRNLLRLMFEPPFLAFTLALVAAMLLAGWQALGRFGPPLAEGRALPFGKRALVDNAATLIARARRERALGERYVALVREAAGAALGSSAKDPAELEAWLARLPGDFAGHAAAVRAAPDAERLRDAAAALHRWKKDHAT